MIDFIDNFLNNITMYRLVLYFLIILLSIASIFAILGLIPYGGFAVIITTFFIMAVSLLTNELFAKTFKAPVNVESVYISALILALIITPIRAFADLGFIFWAAVWISASKFIFAINKKHLFNPVTISVFLIALFLNKSATWWVGNVYLFPFVLTGGLLIVRKIKRFDLVLSFFAASFLTILVFSLFSGASLISTFNKTLFYSPWLFFGFVMLTEPLTTPPTRNLRIVYGSLVGLLFAPQFHIGSFYTTPEMALIIGNIFSFFTGPKHKLVLKLKEKIKIAPDIYDFVFALDKPLKFNPGQYMEWTLDHSKPDSRGNRRYFTLASSPTDNEIRIGVKFHLSSGDLNDKGSSSYKKSLLNINTSHPIVASQMAGDFTLQKDKSIKYVFIAGGIGVTPFRSIIKYLVDKGERKDIVLFYSNKRYEDIVYIDVFNKAWQKLGIRTIYTLTVTQNIPVGWQGKTGRIDEKMLTEVVPDYKERMYYLSGPKAMIDGFKVTLKNLGIGNSQIKTDYFPGFV